VRRDRACAPEVNERYKTSKRSKLTERYKFGERSKLDERSKLSQRSKAGSSPVVVKPRRPRPAKNQAGVDSCRFDCA
jgi:hypothetical protein